ncbi:MAG: hypothetical protein V7K21_05215 [Nostoc sp.]
MDKSERYSLELAPICHVAMSTTGYAYAILVVWIEIRLFILFKLTSATTVPLKLASYS